MRLPEEWEEKVQSLGLDPESERKVREQLAEALRVHYPPSGASGPGEELLRREKEAGDARQRRCAALNDKAVQVYYRVRLEGRPKCRWWHRGPKVRLQLPTYEAGAGIERHVCLACGFELVMAAYPGAWDWESDPAIMSLLERTP